MEILKKLHKNYNYYPSALFFSMRGDVIFIYIIKDNFLIVNLCNISLNRGKIPDLYLEEDGKQ